MSRLPKVVVRQSQTVAPEVAQLVSLNRGSCVPMRSPVEAERTSNAEADATLADKRVVSGTNAEVPML